MKSQKLKDFRDLFIHELKDLYSAENMLIKIWPRAAKAASDQRVRMSIEEHHQETVLQKMRLDDISGILNVDLGGVVCEAMKGLIKELKIIMTLTDGRIKDAALVSQAQRIKHYEIAAYGIVISFARQLGLGNVADLLSETLEEEKEVDSVLQWLAINHINVSAFNQDG
jgi:ferritin-like metal-binding protein YciE